MNRTALFISVGCLIAGPRFLQAQNDSSTVRVVRSSADAVLLIETYDEQGRPLASGTGFLVDSLGTVVTNHHVMTGAVTARVLNHNREASPVTGWIRVNPEADLLTLRAQFSAPTPWLRLGPPAPPEPGTDLIVIGSPRGLAQTVTTGVSSGLQEVEGRRMLQLSALASHGSSGSPVLDRAAKVRGVVAAGVPDAPQVVYAVPTLEVAELMAQRDTVKMLSSLPGAATTRARRADDPFATPRGLTHMYQFQDLVGYPFAYVWLVESPSGALSGAAFTQHPTGFVDVIPIQTGVRPGRRRAFEFQAGCGRFEGWIRDQGILAGDVSTVCKDGGSSPFIAVPIGTPPRERRNKLRAIRMYLTRTPTPAVGTTDHATWALLVAVTPKNLGEGTVGAIHLWGEILGRTGRVDLTFGRGRSDSTSLTLETTDESNQLRMTEWDGTITGELVSLLDTTQKVSLEGFRDDLAYCFSKGRDKTAADSILAALAAEDRVIGDSILSVGRALNAPGLANPRSGPLSSSTPGVLDEKERGRLAARAPLERTLGLLSGRKLANGDRRTGLNQRLEEIVNCPELPSARHNP